MVKKIFIFFMSISFAIGIYYCYLVTKKYYIGHMIVTRCVKLDNKCFKWSQEFQKLPGYWKDIYKIHYFLAYLYLKKGYRLKSRELIHRALKFHPYYPNAYLLMTYVTDDNKSRACCKRVVDIIMELGKRPDDFFVSCCIGKPE